MGVKAGQRVGLDGAWCHLLSMDASSPQQEKLQRLLEMLSTGSRHVYAACCAVEVAEAAAQYHGMRRSDQPGRDQLVYRAGSAIEVANGLHLDDYWLLGALTAPEVPAWLGQLATEAPAHTLQWAPCVVDLFNRLFEDNAKRRYLISMGAWRRHHWSQAAYRNAVAEFEASEKAAGGRWEAKPPTAKQTYAIEQITRTFAAVTPDFEAPQLSTRRAAHDWIALNAGNPRFADNINPPKYEDFNK